MEMGWIFTKPKTHLANFALCSLLGEVAHIDHRERKSRVILFAEYTYPSHSRGQNVQLVEKSTMLQLSHQKAGLPWQQAPDHR